MMKKKLAMIGCGGIGGYHLGHFKQFTDLVELAGFCDLIPERAADYAGQVGGKAFSDYREMYDEIQPDLVFICIPPTQHGEIELETIRRGIPFFVEKPVALSLELAHKIRDAAAEKNLITASGFQCRYSALVPPNRRFMEENQVLYVNCVRMGGIPGVEWWKKRSTSGGQIVEQTIHQYDIIRYMLGEPVSVFTYGARGFITDVEGYDTEDLSTTVVRFENGALATIATGCYVTEGASADSKVTFSARGKRADLYILDKFTVYGEAPAEAPAKEDFVVKNDGGFRAANTEGIEYKEQGDAGIACDRTFIEAVISGDGSQIRSPYADAVKSLAFTLACNQSMDEKREVIVER